MQENLFAGIQQIEIQTSLLSSSLSRKLKFLSVLYALIDKINLNLITQNVFCNVFFKIIIYDPSIRGATIRQKTNCYILLYGKPILPYIL